VEACVTGDERNLGRKGKQTNMKTKTFVSLITILIGLAISTQAQVIVSGGGSSGTGTTEVTNVDEYQFSFLSPTENVVWQAGSTQGIKYESQNLVGNDGAFRLEVAWGDLYLSSFHIADNGNDGDAFKVPFWLRPGTYNLRADIWSAESGKQILSIPGVQITVTSPISVPSTNSVWKAGSAHVVKWSGQDITKDWFLVYLTGPGGYEPIGVAPVRRGRALVRIPKNAMPGTYRLELRGGMSSSGYSDEFQIVNKDWHGNPGPGSGDYGGGKGIKAK
jgi:hypothetical protein